MLPSPSTVISLTSPLIACVSTIRSTPVFGEGFGGGIGGTVVSFLECGDAVGMLGTTDVLRKTPSIPLLPVGVVL
jgi:hypothetical protein